MVAASSTAPASPSTPTDVASRPIGYEQHWNLTIPTQKTALGIDPADLDAGDGAAPQEGSVVHPITGGFFSILLRFLAGF